MPLAHGRNIVNVILVDFRALDTMGEITVLATAAIGVRAVFRLGRRTGATHDFVDSAYCHARADAFALLYGIFLLLRGHNAPGGGFAGGLVVAAAYALHSFAFGRAAARRALLVDPSRLIGSGLLLALACGALPVLFGETFLTALWLAQTLVSALPYCSISAFSLS